MMINEIKDNEEIKIVALISKVTRGTTSNNGQYLSITLQDNSGTIEAKKWDASDEDIKSIETGKVIEIEGATYTYGALKSLQVKISNYRILENGDELAETLVKSAPVPLDELENTLKEFVLSIKDKDLSSLVKEIYRRHYNKIIIHPAAMSNHHEFRSGLLYHTLSMAKIGDMVCSYYKNLDRDLLISGILLHDIGKIEELTSCIAPRYTVEGNLIGHISIMAAEIREVSNQLGIQGELPILLEHMILSHHGKREFGSPVLPETREALVLSIIDDMDAKLNTIDKELDKVNEGEFTAFIRALDGRSFYKPHKRD